MEVSANLEELRRRLAAAAAEGKTNLADLFREMGLSPDNPAAIRHLLLEAGLKPEDMGDKEKLAQFVNQMTQSLTPEMKKNIAALYSQMAKDMESEIPEDLQRFLTEWQKR